MVRRLHDDPLYAVMDDPLKRGEGGEGVRVVHRNQTDNEPPKISLENLMFLATTGAMGTAIDFPVDYS